MKRVAFSLLALLPFIGIPTRGQDFTAKPDLKIVQYFDYAQILDQDQNWLIVSVTVKNDGDAPAKLPAQGLGFKVQLVDAVSSKAYPDPAGTVRFQSSDGVTGPLDAGATRVYFAEYNLKAVDVPSNVYKLVTLVDPANEIVESNKNNNTFSATIYLAPGKVLGWPLPDLSVRRIFDISADADLVSFSEECWNNSTDTVMVGTFNLKFTLINRQTGVRYLLGYKEVDPEENGHPHTDNPRLADLPHLSPLTYDVYGNSYYRNNLPSGDYWIEVRTNYNNSHLESNEDNNTTTAPVTLP